ncbi:MAG TPA: hypothetical protein VMT52_18170 [Planctomycetota bacterium]|nr:hypothetical protein [Planctomycetota bacterium]
MRHAGVVMTAVIFLFWGTMNTLLVFRERKKESLGQYRAHVAAFHKDALLRERWFSIFRKNVKIGYTGFKFEKVFAAEGIEIRSTVESKVKIELFGASQWVEIQGLLVADDAMKPVSLRLDATLETLPAMSLTGKREGDSFQLSIETGFLPPVRLSLPLQELQLGDAFGPSLPIAGLEVGETFEVPCFDPIALERALATVRVVARETRSTSGLSVDAFRIETTFRGVMSLSWVTEAGEVLLQELGPPFEGVRLIGDTPQNAKRINPK